MTARSFTMLKLPGADGAVVQDAKVRDYLLSPSHPVGRFKAQFFVRLGYSRDGWKALAADLQRHAVDGTSVELAPSAYGRRFEIRGSIVGPNGRAAQMVSIWLLPRGTDTPRLVTAFPG